MLEKIVIVFRQIKNRMVFDSELEIPTNMTANDLIVALNQLFDLGMNINKIQSCYLKAENPIALLKGDKTIADIGLINGSIVIYNDNIAGEKFK
jgi:uncharacterized ubiquitin-like protein YukD